jgi:hypothetical protein
MPAMESRVDQLEVEVDEVEVWQDLPAEGVMIVVPAGFQARVDAPLPQVTKEKGDEIRVERRLASG